GTVMDASELNQLKAALVEALDEYLCPNPPEIAPKWDGGVLVMKPGDETQEKEVPLDVFFKKIVTVRDSLRVFEQKINIHDKLTTEDKATFQGYITKAYGTLTTFNILFKDGKDRFVGSGKGGGGGSSSQPKMTVAEAKRQLGLNEYKRD